MPKDLLDDLKIDEFLRRFFDNPAQYATCEPETIRNRNEICQFLLRNETLTAALQRLYFVSLQIAEKGVAEEPIAIIQSMHGIRAFYDEALAASQAIDACEERPAIFKELSHGLRELLQEQYPDGFTYLWETYASGVQKPSSLSYDVRFQDDLSIASVSLSGVYNKRYTKLSFAGRVSGAPAPMQVDSLLILIPGYYTDAAVLLNPYRSTASLKTLVEAVGKMLSIQTALVKNQIVTMNRKIAACIVELVEDLRFALGAVQYAQTLRACTKFFCFAEIRESKEHSLCIKKMVHPLIAEREAAVANDVSIQNGEEMILLGGVNRGGKTVYLQTMGAIQFLFQMGLPIPAASAAISPVSGIFSVFSRDETAEMVQGKLGRELTELRDSMAMLNENSLFLGNEPISGTSPEESTLLSREALCMLKVKRARGIWVTHLYELFDDVDKLNKLDFGSRFACMHTESTVGVQRSYVILPGIPERHSGAKELFQRASV